MSIESSLSADYNQLFLKNIVPENKSQDISSFRCVFAITIQHLEK